MAQGDTIHKPDGEMSAKSASDAQASSPIHSGGDFSAKAESYNKSLANKVVHQGSGSVKKGGVKYSKAN